MDLDDLAAISHNCRKSEPIKLLFLDLIRYYVRILKFMICPAIRFFANTQNDFSKKYSISQIAM